MSVPVFTCERPIYETFSEYYCLQSSFQIRRRTFSSPWMARRFRFPRARALNRLSTRTATSTTVNISSTKRVSVASATCWSCTCRDGNNHDGSSEEEPSSRLALLPAVFIVIFCQYSHSHHDASNFCTSLCLMFVTLSKQA